MAKNVEVCRKYSCEVTVFKKANLANDAIEQCDIVLNYNNHSCMKIITISFFHGNWYFNGQLYSQMCIRNCNINALIYFKALNVGAGLNLNGISM